MVGDWGGENTSVFERTFDVPHDLPVTSITWLDNIPMLLKEEYLDESGTLLDTVYSIPQDERTIITSNNAQDCKKIRVSILATLPYQRARIVKINYRETDFTLRFSEVKEQGEIAKRNERLKNIYVHQFYYEKSPTQDTLYSATVGKGDYHIEFDLSTDITITVDGADWSSHSEIYGQAADIHITASGNHTVLVKGYALKENSIVHSRAVNPSGEDDEEKNPLITNSVMATNLANHIVNYLSMRNIYERDYRGNPELETGDIIGLQTMFTDEINALILEDSIDFKGSLSGGIKLKGLI